MSKDYYVGLDIGTESIGWAVTDENYNLLKKNGKSLWGIRLFDKADTAEDRRLHRTTRRRGQRKIQRIQLLQELFAEEISEVDPGFYQRLKDSKFLKGDKEEKQTNTLFYEADFNDKKYHESYPTIYHLRKSLLVNNQKNYDVRLVYLALHHIVKHRGHFLFEGNLGNITSFENVFKQLIQYLEDEYDIRLECNSIIEVENVLKSHNINSTEKKLKLINLFSVGKADIQLKAIFGLLAGLKGKLSEVFQDNELKNYEIEKISFAEADYEKQREFLEDELQDKVYLLDKLKAIYDWAILSEILEGGEVDGKCYLSVAKVKLYDDHKKDLKLLKKVIRENCSSEDYKKVFSSNEENANYCAYIGMNKKNGKKQSVKRCKKEEFYGYIKGILKKINIDDNSIKEIEEKMIHGEFLRLQVNRENGVIPYQVHKMELEIILENASTYLPFLNEIDDEGITVKEKIIKIFKFRIPYYVGPLNDFHKNQGSNCWIVRKDPGRILPWNFERKVDIESSAEAFIERMTNKCTYLVNKDVIPKYSLLYMEFMVWNELNNVKIRQEKLPIELKIKVFEDVFKKNKKVTRKKLRDYLRSEGCEFKDDELTGFDGDFKASLTSYIDFGKTEIFGNSIKNKSIQVMIEQIILWITLFGDDRELLQRKIKNIYRKELSDSQIKNICKLKYNGWGRLSREFLQEVEGMDRRTGVVQTLIQALRNTNDNLMELLSLNYTYCVKIEELNAKEQNITELISYETMIRDLYISPKVKRSLWQAVRVMEEIKKVCGKEPTKIFIEMARGTEEKKRTVSRKDKLIELYKNCKNEEREWIKELEQREERDFQDRKLYLYYTQMGKCMYTGKSITLDELYNKTTYDKDHIYPQSKTKDDSIQNNLVLVDKTANWQKDIDIVPLEIQQKMEPFWRQLKHKGLITEEKYNRLTRKTNLTDEELAGFINRQLVETRQATKVTASLLKSLYSTAEIVYVKAKAVSDFRKDELDMLKVRDINDYHHAKDAYLNIVVGNVYHTKFTSNPLKWLKFSKDKKYSLNKMFSYDVMDKEKLAWKRGKDGTISLVRKTMKKNNILFTRHALSVKSGQNGGLFNQQMVGKLKGATVQIKKDNRLKVNIYGGYKTKTNKYFMLVESLDKRGNIQRTIETVPLYLAVEFEKDIEKLLNYCREEFKLQEPKIIIPKIKKNSYIVMNGFPMHLKGSTGSQLIFQGAVQLCLDEDNTKYLKQVYKYLEKNSKRKDKRKNLMISEFDKIHFEKNILIYDMLIQKHKYTIYKYRPAGQIEKLEKGRETFIKLSLEEQCIVIGEIMKLFACKPETKANLKSIGGDSNAGGMKTSKKISNCNMVRLINQSPTGIFEQEIDLLTV
ncbi:type II CRISPR RNA-guided endonuclease Cas9 [Anaerosacchariphilus polymeriproducens]|uniref:CRISPR-associated endonuclease Cas9 n=1 Tax=Anaerosacchariphilus polymeriproducens TaxID=1812858 RepID=A0A371ARY2_9FIRM|nr:type II CRISPR RNA-guided endonuclease Cas9 [Anaerosacchariphilus polymeriproducens]